NSLTGQCRPHRRPPEAYLDRCSLFICPVRHIKVGCPLNLQQCLGTTGRLQDGKCLLDIAPIVVNIFHESLRGGPRMNKDWAFKRSMKGELREACFWICCLADYGCCKVCS
ncbi:hypothetical protein CH063_02768, partial [Colletotrichum higginsianum]